MKDLTKQEKLNYIINHCKKNDITAYEIGKNTGLNVSGIDRIIKGMTENPNNSTINLIYDFLKNPEKFTLNEVNEPKEDYSNIKELQLYVIELQKDVILLEKEKARLMRLLETHNIPY
jgi:transcriptional regulator with XRE-family HTH domain